ncbi:acyloxyacyl hydrolase [Rhizobiaceae bacterium BDR2-2]|uniref:Acyloxyacyl hydrolase n=1 Tax=Ectorhizobium quercum TaxID=2965071 RepID=A0AAE3N2K1_9HYPH|nr:acyloxyacyl hydrolase [Ectorhizobium quercum]MCX8999873.1 acyloxyacyl hydrolase [Ectorhizobium quercum]
MRRFWSIVIAGSVSSAAVQDCLAGDRLFDELRFGASASVQSGNSRESGAFPELTAFFDPLGLDEAVGWQQQLARPRIGLGTSVGTSGEATQVFGGLSWQFSITERIFTEAGFGVTWHDGKLEHNADGPELGCRFLLREHVGAGYRFNAHWSAIAQVAHSSHANLCDGPNDGATRAGIQLGYKF